MLKRSWLHGGIHAPISKESYFMYIGESEVKWYPHPCIAIQNLLFRIIKIFMMRKQLPREKGSDNACYQFQGSSHPTRYKTRWWIHKCWQIFQPRLVWIFLTKD